MKKILLALVICMFFSGCSYTFETTDSELPPPEFFLRLEVVSKTRDFETVYRDEYTDVLYYRIKAYHKASLTPIMKADGTCLTYSEWKETVSQKPSKN